MNKKKRQFSFERKGPLYRVPNPRTLKKKSSFLNALIENVSALLIEQVR